MKIYFGIAAMCYAKFIAEAGVWTAAIGTTVVLCMNLYTIWLLVKARNRFKNERIVSLSDLGVLLYGDGVEVFITII